MEHKRSDCDQQMQKRVVKIPVCSIDQLSHKARDSSFSTSVSDNLLPSMRLKIRTRLYEIILKSPTKIPLSWDFFLKGLHHHNSMSRKFLVLFHSRTIRYLPRGSDPYGITILFFIQLKQFSATFIASLYSSSLIGVKSPGYLV